MTQREPSTPMTFRTEHVPSKGGRETGLSKPQSQLQASAGSHTEIGAQIFPLLTFPKI